jgi:adenine-specific DNA-methyltransferase
MSEEALKVYNNPDDDLRGAWRTAPLTVSLLTGSRGESFRRTGKSSGLYDVVSPTGKVHRPGPGRAWISRQTFEELEADSRIWWGKDGNAVPMKKRFLSETEGLKAIGTFWNHKDYGSNKKANEEIKQLFPENTGANTNFPTPKPTLLIKSLCQIATQSAEHDIILDFFAGSSTTADAVLDLNRQDGGNRKFVMVQLPEAIPREDFATIAEIGKERIRRVIKKLNEEEASQLRPEDTPQDRGFKVFKLTSSNFKIWDDAGVSKEPEDLANQLRAFAENVLSDRSPEDILYEILLKSGLPLTAEVERLEVAGREVYAVSGGLLMVWRSTWTTS